MSNSNVIKTSNPVHCYLHKCQQIIRYDPTKVVKGDKDTFFLLYTKWRPRLFFDDSVNSGHQQNDSLYLIADTDVVPSIVICL